MKQVLKRGSGDIKPVKSAVTVEDQQQNPDHDRAKSQAIFEHGAYGNRGNRD
jgi:hypothetical protein